jgi:molybdenum cofactor synthesis domain-containing protein
LLTRPRAVIVVTGSELVRGERTDRNGPFLAAQALALGLEPARITIVGDRPEELLAAFEEGSHADICLVSGGLGPTHDDRTAELVAQAAGVELVIDPALEAEIEGISRAIATRLRRPYGDFAPGVRKQASLPAGALSLGLAGTAPGFVVDGANGPFVVLPGPPMELQRLWPRALETEAVRRVHSGPGDASCASTERASRRSRGPSRRRAATATASRRRSAPVTSRSTSTYSSIRAPKSAPTSSCGGCARRSSSTSSARTSGPSRSSCWGSAAPGV